MSLGQVSLLFFDLASKKRNNEALFEPFNHEVVEKTLWVKTDLERPLKLAIIEIDRTAKVFGC